MIKVAMRAISPELMARIKAGASGKAAPRAMAFGPDGKLDMSPGWKTSMETVNDARQSGNQSHFAQYALRNLGVR